MPGTAIAPHVAATAVRLARGAQTLLTSASRALAHPGGSAPLAGDAGPASSSREALLSVLQSAEAATYGPSTELPDLSRLLAEGHGKLDTARFRAFVLLLGGCVTDVAPKLRSVLRLRSGLKRPHPLSTRELAARLHTSRKHVRSLEVKALRALLHVARTTGCAVRTQQRSAPELLFVGYLTGAGGTSSPTPSPGFGVAGAREERSPSDPRALEGSPPGQPPASTLLGLRPGSSAFWLLAAIPVAMLLIALGVLDNLGVGPRHRYRSGLKHRK